MKKVIPIQSISDVITNSSSEVYLMDLQDALEVDYIKKFGFITELTENFIKTLDSESNNGYIDVDVASLLMTAAGISKEDQFCFEGLYKEDTLEYWKSYVEENWENYFKSLLGKCIFELSDQEYNFNDLMSIVKDIKKHGGQHLDGRNFMKGL